MNSPPITLSAERPRAPSTIVESSPRSKASSKTRQNRDSRAFDFSSVATSVGHIKRGTTLARLQDTSRRSTGRRSELSSSPNVDSVPMPIDATPRAIATEPLSAPDLTGMDTNPKENDDEMNSIDLSTVRLEYIAIEPELKPGSYRFPNARNPYSPAQMIYTAMPPMAHRNITKWILRHAWPALLTLKGWIYPEYHIANASIMKHRWPQSNRDIWTAHIAFWSGSTSVNCEVR